MPRLCVRGARGRFGGFGPVPGVVSLPFPPSRSACPALRVAGRPVRVSLTLPRWYAIPRGLCVPRARSGCPSGSSRVPFACVCAPAPALPPPPPLGGVACEPRAVPALGAGRAVPRGPCPSACPAPVPCSVPRAWGGAVRSRFPPAWLGVVGVAEGRPRGGVPSTVARGVWGQAPPLPKPPAHWAGCWGPLPTCCGRGRVSVGALHCPLGLHALWGLRAAGVVGGRPPTWLGAVRPPWGGSVAFVCRRVGWGGGRGAARARCPPFVRPGGGCRAGGRSASFRPSAFLGRQQSGCHWRRSVHGGRGPPYHSRSCSPAFTGRDLCGVLARWRGLACSPRFPWEPAAGAGGRVALRLLSQAGGGGTIPPASGVGGRGPRGLRAGGGVGGGSRRGLPAPPLGGGPQFPTLAPLLSSAHSTPACACRLDRGAAPGGGGMRGGPWTAPLGAPSDLNRPSALPEWQVVMGGSSGARPPCCRGAPPCAAPRLGPQAAPARRFGLARRPRPPREQAAGGSRARVGQIQRHPPPPASRSLLGQGGRLLGSRGGGGSLQWPSSWGGGGGDGGVGGPPPRPPAPSGVGLPSVVSGVPPGSILVPWRLPGGRGRRARPGRPPMGQCGGGEGRGGESPPPWFAPPSIRAGF